MPMPDWTMVTTSNTVFNQVFASSSLEDQTYGIRRLGPTINPDTVSGVFATRDNPHPNPINSNGSLLIRALSSGHVGHNYRANPGQRGWVNGAITSRWQINASAPAGGFGFGYYCFANQLDLRSGGQAYLIGCADTHLGQGSVYDLFLAKITSGLLGYISAVHIVSALSNQWTVGGIFNIRVTWTQAASSVTLHIFTGTSSDFSDFTEKISYSDPSPLSTTVAEGFWGASEGSTNLKAYTDVTEFFKGVYSA